MKHDKQLTEWARVLRKAGNQVDDVPEGWETNRQIAEREGVATPTSTSQLRKAIEAGLVEVKTFKILTPAGARRVPHYRIKSKPGK